MHRTILRPTIEEQEVERERYRPERSAIARHTLASFSV